MHRRSSLNEADQGKYLWRVPRAQNPGFIGRNAVLAALRQTFVAAGFEGVAQVVYGGGGLGKTQLAIEYAYRHRHNYGLVWWLSADDPVRLSLEFAKLIEALHIDAGETVADAPGRQIRKALDQWDDWLLIFDNAAGPEIIKPYLPGGGHVLVTSRCPEWRGVGKSFCLRVLEREDSITLLKRRSGHPKADGLAERAAQALGDLPLALELAGATIAATRINFQEYLTRFENYWAELLSSGRPSGDYSDALAMAGELALREVESGSAEAAALLKVASFLGDAPITHSLLQNAAQTMPAPLSRVLADSLTINEAVGALGSHGLVEASDTAFSVPRIIASLTRDRMAEDERVNWCQVAMGMLSSTFRFSEGVAGRLSDLPTLLPHAQAVAQQAERLTVLPDVASKLLNEVGQFLFHIGEYAQAKSTFERALAMNVHAYGPNNPRRSVIATNIGRVLKRLGDLQAARAHFEQALQQDESAYGEHHPHVAEAANNVGACLQMAGDMEGARKQFEWALAVCETHFGAEHPKVAAVVNNLGYALKGLGDVDEALEHFERALNVAESTYGSNHPAVATINANLGVALRLKGETHSARRRFERAISIIEQSLGLNHPDLSRHLTHLGLLLQDEGDLAGARRQFERALSIDQRAFGPTHLSVVTRLNHLSRCLKAMGKVDEAAKHHAAMARIMRGVRQEERMKAAAQIDLTNDLNQNALAADERDAPIPLT